MVDWSLVANDTCPSTDSRSMRVKQFLNGNQCLHQVSVRHEANIVQKHGLKHPLSPHHGSVTVVELGLSC